MAQEQYRTATADLGSLVFRSLSILNAHRAGSPSLGTAPTPSAQQTVARPPVVNDEALIAEGHRQRREMLAQRRAEQQLQILLTDSQRLGVSLSTEAMVRTVIAAYTDTLNCARR